MFYMVLLYDELLCMQLHVIYKSLVFISFISSVAILTGIINIAINTTWMFFHPKSSNH